MKEVPETTSMQTERAAEVLLPLTCFIVLLLSVIQRFLFDSNCLKVLHTVLLKS